MNVHYLHSFDPPAPAISLEIAAGKNGETPVQLEALVDTGADITAIPASVAARISPVPVGRLLVQGATGEKVLPTFAVWLQLGEELIGPIEVILMDFDFVVLGRDVLNRYRLVLDGPELQGQLL